MELHVGPDGIVLNEKVVTKYDRFMFDFVALLEREGVSYVLVSGYIAILFGRSRHTEDIDLVIEDLDQERFLRLWTRLAARFECINTSKPDVAYTEYLRKSTALRFSDPGKYIPNMEMKFVHQPLEREALNKRVRVALDDTTLWISPIELQIAFKLFLGSEKDIEDAKHLYLIFKTHIKPTILAHYVRLLKQESAAKRYLYG